jgi:hypothetical protein
LTRRCAEFVTSFVPVEERDRTVGPAILPYRFAHVVHAEGYHRRGNEMSRIFGRLSMRVAICAAVFAAGSREVSALSCGELRLMDASGVIGPLQRYTVTARCGEEHFTKHAKMTWTGYESGATNQSISLGVLGKASWDRKTGMAKETLAISGDASGERVTTGTCNQDPFLKDPPGGPASCHAVSAQYQSRTGPIYEFFTSPVFFLARKITLAEAQALSGEKGAENAPPPPPAPVMPQHKTMKSLSGVQVWEGEDFLRTHRVLLVQGKLSSQVMTGFGPGWGGNAQLLWTEGQKGAMLDLEILVGKRGTYKVSLALTQGPDFGIIQAQVDTSWSNQVFDGYSPTVTRVDSKELGNFKLNAGPGKVRLKILGKDPRSTGFLVGIDRITITPFE